MSQRTQWRMTGGPSPQSSRQSARIKDQITDRTADVFIYSCIYFLFIYWVYWWWLCFYIIMNYLCEVTFWLVSVTATSGTIGSDWLFRNCCRFPHILGNLVLSLSAETKLQKQVLPPQEFVTWASCWKHSQTPALTLWLCGWDSLITAALSCLVCPVRRTTWLQDAQNSAAGVLTCIKSWQHITPTLMQLHWLPVRSHTAYKILLLLHHIYSFGRL